VTSALQKKHFGLLSSCRLMQVAHDWCLHGWNVASIGYLRHVRGLSATSSIPIIKSCRLTGTDIGHPTSQHPNIAISTLLQEDAHAHRSHLRVDSCIGLCGA
jgi:hypothetical protein